MALFSFCLAGLFEVLVSRELLVTWMGKESGVQGILLGWLVGLLMPGGLYSVDAPEAQPTLAEVG